jgi:hypothetical protein
LGNMYSNFMQHRLSDKREYLCSCLLHRLFYPVLFNNQWRRQPVQNLLGRGLVCLGHLYSNFMQHRLSDKREYLCSGLLHRFFYPVLFSWSWCLFKNRHPVQDLLSGSLVCLVCVFCYRWNSDGRDLQQH